MLLRFAVVFVLLLIAELLYFKVADHFNIVDKPNERSSHSRIVLRGGGIIFVVGMWLWAAFFGFHYLWFLIGLTLIAGVSFVDDIHSLPDGMRLVAQFVAMFLMFADLGILNWESWWIVAIALIACVGVINAFNFMDGINGITGGYSLAVLIPLIYLNVKLQFIEMSFLVVAALAVLVFCFFNFRKRAKCFAGDVGSVGIAFIIVFALGKLILCTGDFTYIMFLAVYGVDAVLTICHRILLHEHLGEAHRKHCYQLMANELKMPHTLVASIYMLLQLIISFVMVFLPSSPAWHWGYLAFVLVVLCCAYMLFMRKYYHLHEEYLASLK